ncbi:hypothetical protein [Pediococcus damnosus]|uniref:hypothetical protein n=1 Tax=Pediococcus damnosus TaxID=51663 RepID=UPI00078C6395|nr:hypothetical protein [Pediococcus damnosus]AMV60768.1 Hypothetical protein ADU69_1107 [Pediococcus damnosus]AMV65079.1 Hypothetical protein ADU71_1181 [Pediococcus damnosus]AMV69892.1 Hypothetical protein ADU73_1500 [Pediococcus damnosus]
MKIDYLNINWVQSPHILRANQAYKYLSAWIIGFYLSREYHGFKNMFNPEKWKLTNKRIDEAIDFFEDGVNNMTEFN